MSTESYQDFSNALVKIVGRKSSDAYLNQLLYANVITIFEVYLQDIAFRIMHSSDVYLSKITATNKYRNHKITLTAALTTNIRQYVHALVRNLVFHNLTEVDPFFREAFDVKIPISEEIFTAISKRHDIIHRNGRAKDGKLFLVTETILDDVCRIFDEAARIVDQQVERLLS